MNILFDDKVIKDGDVLKKVEAFLQEVNTLEITKNSPIIIYQDGKSKGYYIKSGILSEVICPLLDMNAKLDPTGTDSFRANREALNRTYIIPISVCYRMQRKEESLTI